MRGITLPVLLVWLASSAQFDAAGGEQGSKSVHKDDASIVAWASGASMSRGYLQINDTAAGKPTVGTESSALGVFDGEVVSLGDGGVITLTFDQPIVNNEGYDFAVFENGFKVGFSYYLELAHVEVSQNGTDFVRFASESLSDTSFQTDNFGYTDPQKIRNLAGKHQAPYGTLFDLEEVGLEEVNYIRLIDVVGSVNDSLGSRDSKGRIINDPFPTPFASGGFDLDAVAIVNGAMLSVFTPKTFSKANPLVTNSLARGEVLKLKVEWADAMTSSRDIQGKTIYPFSQKPCSFDTPGIYIITILQQNQQWVQKIVVY